MIRNRHMLTLFLFIWFILEGTLLKWLIPGAWQAKVFVTLHPVLILVILIGIYVHRHDALLYGLLFGLLHDITYYGPMIGTYCLACGLAGYLAGLVAERLPGNILNAMFIVVSCYLIFEWLVFGIYRVFRVTNAGAHWAFLHEMLPGVLINLLFALVIYVPMRRWLEGLGSRERTEAG